MIKHLKKFIEWVLLVLILLAAVSFLADYNLRNIRIELGIEAQSEAIELLLARKDKEALALFEKLLLQDPQNIEALWGKGEIYRRSYRFAEAEEIFKKILSVRPGHPSSLLSLAFIRYRDDDLDDAIKTVNKALAIRPLDRRNKALAYMILGTINSRRSQKGWLLSKVAYGMQIKGYFLKAKVLAPDLPEVRLGLGTFYLLAPAVIGGDVDKAIEELSAGVKLAPDFATVNIRLAQAYKLKGDEAKYEFYIRRAREIEPGGENLDDAGFNNQAKAQGPAEAAK